MYVTFDIYLHVYLLNKLQQDIADLSYNLSLQIDYGQTESCLKDVLELKSIYSYLLTLSSYESVSESLWMRALEITGSSYQDLISFN